jgi:hypothetical protein
MNDWRVLPEMCGKRRMNHHKAELNRTCTRLILQPPANLEVRTGHHFTDLRFPCG